MRWLDKRTRIKRNELILRLRARGVAVEQIAAQTNLTPRGVENVLYKAKKRRANCALTS